MMVKQSTWMRPSRVEGNKATCIERIDAEKMPSSYPEVEVRPLAGIGFTGQSSEIRRA